MQDKEEWDKGWMLLLQAIMRRRVKDWFGDAGLHGGKFVPDAQTLLGRLHRARAKRDCRRWALCDCADAARPPRDTPG